MEISQPGAPLDLEGFRSAMREVGVEEIVEPTLEVYVAEAATIFNDLMRAMEAGATEAARMAAHSLKSSSANVHAVELPGLLERVETAASRGDAAEVRGLSTSVRTEYEAVIAFLAERGFG